MHRSPWPLSQEHRPEACMVVCSSDLASVGLLTVVDNAVEDGFKALCVWSHYRVGNLVGVAVFSTLRTPAMAPSPEPQGPKAPRPQGPKAPRPQGPKAPRPQGPKAPRPQGPKAQAPQHPALAPSPEPTEPEAGLQPAPRLAPSAAAGRRHRRRRRPAPGQSARAVRSVRRIR